jgi:hypothetical protein
VSLIHGIRRGLFEEEAVAVTERLLADRDDMVQKGLGWLLREWAKHDPKAAVPVLMAIRHRAPRLCFAPLAGDSRLRTRVLGRCPRVSPEPRVPTRRLRDLIQPARLIRIEVMQPAHRWNASNWPGTMAAIGDATRHVPIGWRAWPEKKAIRNDWLCSARDDGAQQLLDFGAHRPGIHDDCGKPGVMSAIGPCWKSADE